MTDRQFFHDGMRELQDRYDGRRIADAIADSRVHTAFWDAERALIAASPFFFLATAHDGHVDCTIKSGDPGFVHITGPNILEYPDYDGNSMYRSLGNMIRSPRVGLLFVRFDGKSLRCRASGLAAILDDADSLARHHGARRVVRVTCDEIYPNCPRYVPDLAGDGRSVYTPRPGSEPPVPEWKTREHLAPLLPATDPARKP
jgi:predicted pyridoxine 5'-phosphate oxidase superfamily flavin-nucleotide-binding protein